MCFRKESGVEVMRKTVTETVKRGVDLLDLTTQLREAITSGRFLPNERLIEEDLARLLKTNRTNIRKALARLEHEGLVVHERNRGARVRLVSESEAIEIVEVRAALEALVARRAALNASASDLAQLLDILQELRRRRSSGDPIGYAATNVELHQTILRIAAHETASRFLSMLKSQSVSFQYRSILQPGRLEHSIREHEKLVKAIVRHDPDAAEAAMRNHLDNAVAALKQSITVRLTALAGSPASPKTSQERSTEVKRRVPRAKSTGRKRR